MATQRPCPRGELERQTQSSTQPMLTLQRDPADRHIPFAQAGCAWTQVPAASTAAVAIARTVRRIGRPSGCHPTPIGGSCRRVARWQKGNIAHDLWAMLGFVSPVDDLEVSPEIDSLVAGLEV